MFEGLFQPTHLLIIMGIALVVFGPGKLGDIGGQLGRGIREFKQAMTGIDDIAKDVTTVGDPPTVDPAAAPKSTTTPA
ncbi:MAG TPA: twin-arginine translocase TatA/TatE family subunit [Chloroflexota bacterium]|nr:twin-arginine translocase TatA/TatE family subunit [Chloroflexota bacterium]